MHKLNLLQNASPLPHASILSGPDAAFLPMRRAALENAVDVNRSSWIGLVGSMARSDVPILLHGQNEGEIVALARWLHRLSSRALRPMAVVDCGSSRGEEMEPLLFGFEKLLSSGARHIKTGVFERCPGGTVQLTNITAMPPQVQARLLGLLDAGKLCRVGGQTWVDVDVRIFTSTALNVEASLSAGLLRPDFYYRFQVIESQLAPGAIPREGDLARHSKRKPVSRVARANPGSSLRGVIGVTRT